MENMVCAGKVFPRQAGYPAEKRDDTAKKVLCQEEESDEFMDRMSLLHELREEAEKEKGPGMGMEARIRRNRERREEIIKEQQKRLAKKKLRKLWFEKRAEQRENYSEFLKTGKRYATPCPAVEMLAKQSAVVRSLSGFLGM